MKYHANYGPQLESFQLESIRIELSLGSSRTVAAASVRHKLNQLNNKKQYMFVNLHTPFDKL